MEETKKKRKVSPYIYLLIIVLCYLTAGFSQYRLQPVMTYLMTAMQISEVQVGTLVSAISILSIFLAIPFGVLMGRIGPRKTGIIATALIIVGGIIGAFGTTNYIIMFISQIVTGAGMCATGILGPYIIACLFEPSLRGRANGIYIVGGTLAQLIMFNLVPRITSPINLSPAWWFVVAYSVAMLVLWIITITDKVAPPIAAPVAANQPAKKQNPLVALKDPKVLQLSIGAMFFMLSTMSIMSYLSPFLVIQHGYTEEAAGTLISGLAIIGAVSTALGGTLSDLLKTRKWIYFAAVLWMAVSRFLLAFLPDGILLHIVIWGQGIPAVAMGLLYTVAGEVLGEKASVGISVINTALGIGTLVSSIIFGAIVSAAGYVVALCVMGGLTVLGFFGVCTIKGVK